MVHASLENPKISEQCAIPKLIACCAKITCDYVRSTSYITDPSLENAVIGSTAVAGRPKPTVHPHGQRVAPQEPEGNKSAQCPATRVIKEFGHIELQEYIFATPVPEICAYLRNNLSTQGKQPPTDHLDCPSPVDIAWEIDSLPATESVYHTVSRNFAAANMLKKGVLAAYISCRVRWQTKYINYILACKQRGSAISASDSELQRLYKKAGITSENMLIDKQIRLQFGVQLLLAGLYSHISGSIAAELYTLGEEDAVLLICYMLSPKHVDRFPKFISALYFFLCKGDPSPHSVKNTAFLVFAVWNRIIRKFSPKTCVALCKASLDVAARCTIPICTAENEAGARAPAIPQHAALLSVHRHAAFAAAAFAAAARRDPLVEALNEAAAAIAKRIPCLMSDTVPWDYWRLLLCELTAVMSKDQIGALIIAWTPPAFASRILQSKIVLAQMRMIIATFWLALQTPHMHGVLETMPGMLQSCNYMYVCYLLRTLPTATLAQMSSDSIEQILLLLVPRNRTSMRQKYVMYADESEGRADDNNGSQDGAVSDVSSAQQTTSCAATAVDATNTAKKQFYLRKRLANSTTRLYAPTLLCRLVLLRRLASDLSGEVVDYLFSNSAITRAMTFVIKDMAKEQSVQGRLSDILWKARHVYKISSHLLAIFGNKHDAAVAVQHRNMFGGFRQRTQQHALYDISWPIYENGKAHLQAISPFFFRQIFPRLAQTLCTSTPVYGYSDYISALAHLLEVGWFQQWMAALEGALSHISVELEECAFHVQHWAAKAQLSMRDGASLQEGAAPTSDMYFLVHNKHPSVPISLALVEQRVQALLSSSPLSVCTYITIAAALEQLAVSLLSNEKYLSKWSISAESARLLLGRIARFKLFGLPFTSMPAAGVGMPGGSIGAFHKVLAFEAPWQAPNYATQFAKAMCTVCYSYILALEEYCNSGVPTSFRNVSFWADIFLWLYSSPSAQHHVAVAMGKSQEHCKTGLASIRLQIKDVQADIANAMADGTASTRIDVVSLVKSLKDLCIAQEGSYTVYAHSLALMARISKPKSTHGRPPRKSDKPEPKQGRKRPREAGNAPAATGTC